MENPKFKKEKNPKKLDYEKTLEEIRTLAEKKLQKNNPRLRGRKHFGTGLPIEGRQPAAGFKGSEEESGE
ncbi:MAG: hypothetical protein HZB99_02580 [Candidatus Harrisonbacteria bacterium]|nr:hypothetical protein [Candidatus Harrisonbacteria bacterium]